MTKKIFFLILIFTLVQNFSFIKGEEESKCAVDNNWNYTSLNKKLDNSDLIMARFYSDDGNIGFCMEPDIQFLPCSSYVNDQYRNDNLIAIAKVIKAYEALGGGDNLYIGAQLMIWDIMGNRQSIDGDIGYGYGRGDIETYIQNNYHTKSPMVENNLEVEMGKIYEIVDQNGLIKDHYSISGEGFTILEKYDNTIKFQIDNIYPVNKQIQIVPKTSVKDILVNQAILYRSNDSQNILQINGSFPQAYNPIVINVKHKTGNLIVHKKDEWGENINGEVSFHLYKAVLENEEYHLGEEIFDEHGKLWRSENGTLKIIDTLPKGYYYLVEAQIDGYVIDDRPILLQINENTTTEFNLYNQNKDVEVSVNKYNLKGEILNGAEFTIYDISEKLDYDNIDTIIQSGISGPILGEHNNLQVTGEAYYPEVSINLLAKDQKVSIADFLLPSEAINQPLRLKLSNESIIENNNDGYITGIKEGYTDFILYQGDYPTIYLKQHLGNFTIYNEHDDDITSDFEIEVSDNGYHFKSNKYYFELDFTIPRTEQAKYLSKTKYEFPLSNNDQLKSGRIYVQNSLDAVYRQIDALEVFKGTCPNQKLLIKNVYNHNLPLKDYSIAIYKTSDNSLYQELNSDDLGYIDISLFEEGDYYYYIKDHKINFEIPLASEGLQFDGLKYNRKYLLCETKTPEGYDYVGNPCVFLEQEDYQASYEFDFVNDIRRINFQLFKTNTNHSIKLNNALFEVVMIPFAMQEQLILEENELVQTKRKYISGGLVIENPANHKFLYLKDDEAKIVKYSISNQDEIILENLKEGEYAICLHNEELNDYEKLDWIKKRVIQGGFVIEDLAYNNELHIKELKAPSGYVKDNNVFKLKPDLAYELITMENYRVNQAIIIPNTRC